MTYYDCMSFGELLLFKSQMFAMTLIRELQMLLLQFANLMVRHALPRTRSMQSSARERVPGTRGLR